MSASLEEKFDRLVFPRPKLAFRESDAKDLSRLHATCPQGADVTLEPGDYEVSQILLPANTRIRGPQSARIIQKPGANRHIFTTEGPAKNIWCEGFSVLGNAGAQEKPTGAGMAFACGFYFKACNWIICRGLSFKDIRQTAIHFVSCKHGIVNGVEVTGAGWSGVSSYRSTDIRIEARIEQAGRDKMHSAVHIDGGAGVYVDVEACDTSGNGIMLDSKAAPLMDCVVKGSATRCKRGLALIGSHEHVISNVAVSGVFCDNREVGVLISNAMSVTVFRAEIGRNPVGILYQGRNGAKHVLLVDTVLVDNGVDMEELQNSAANWRFVDPFVAGADLPTENARTILRHDRARRSWFD